MARRWDEEELEYLESKCGLLSNKEIAKNLNRSHRAIRQKLSKRNISIYDNFYTATVLSKELNRHHSTVMKWYHKGWIKGRLSNVKRGFLHSPMIFTEKNIVKFLKEKWYLFDHKDIPNRYFSNIVKDKQSAIPY